MLRPTTYLNELIYGCGGRRIVYESSRKMLGRRTVGRVCEGIRQGSPIDAVDEAHASRRVVGVPSDEAIAWVSVDRVDDKNRQRGES